MKHANLKNLYIGKQVMVHAYKHNGWLYRTWEFPIVIENNDEFIVLASDNANILTSEFNSKRCFSSNLHSISFWIFFPNKWFNLLISNKNNKTQIYINISSRYLYEECAFKYIDFDLDFKIFNNSWCELDINEFNEAIKIYGYNEKLIKIIKDTEQEILKLIDQGYFKTFLDTNKLHAYELKYYELCKKIKTTKPLNWGKDEH